MSYDSTGFEEAKKESDPTPFKQEELPEVIAFLVSWAEHDYKLGLCSSYQIYNESGAILIDSSVESNPNEAA
jgi:hypothetical protein